MRIRIKSWDKYNPRNDVKRPSWFRLEYDWITDDDFYDYGHDQKLVWIYVLSVACRKRSGEVNVSTRRAAENLRISVERVVETIRAFEADGFLQICEDVTDTSRARDAGVTDTLRERDADVAPPERERDDHVTDALRERDADVPLRDGTGRDVKTHPPLPPVAVSEPGHDPPQTPQTFSIAACTAAAAELEIYARLRENGRPTRPLSTLAKLAADSWFRSPERLAAAFRDVLERRSTLSEFQAKCLRACEGAAAALNEQAQARAGPAAQPSNGAELTH